MKSFLLLLTLTASVTSWAFTYTLTCAKTGELLEFWSAPKQKDCAYFTKQGLTCGDSFTEKSDASAITLRSPLDTFYSTRDSRNYDRALIRNVINGAVEAGVDPYLALSILLIEAPPVSDGNLGYLGIYGAPPLDSLGAADLLGCRKLEVPKYSYMTVSGELKRENTDWAVVIQKVEPGAPFHFEKDDQVIELESSTEVQYILRDKFPTYTPKGDGKPRSFSILGAQDATGENVVIRMYSQQLARPSGFEVAGDLLNAKQCGDACCFDLTVPKNFRKTNDVYKFPTAYVSRLAFAFMERKLAVTANFPFVKKAKDPFERLARRIQGYNGYGKLGSTEPVNNKCLNGLNMKVSPVYGAGAGELMLNALMANSEVRGLVSSALKMYRRQAVHSIFCEEMGAGPHKVDAREFAKLQARFLSGRPCSHHSYTFKSKNGLPAYDPNARGICSFTGCGTAESTQ